MNLACYWGMQPTTDQFDQTTPPVFQLPTNSGFLQQFSTQTIQPTQETLTDPHFVSWSFASNNNYTETNCWSSIHVPLEDYSTVKVENSSSLLSPRYQ